MRIREKKIEIPIYFGKLLMLQGDTLTKVDKHYNNSLGDGNDLNLYGAFVNEKLLEDGSHVYVIVFDKDYDMSLIAHEAVHVAGLILKNAGVKADFDNDEPLAYLVGWVVDEVDKFLNKRK